MRIILDAMGENGVTEAVVKAAVLAKKELSAELVLVGNADVVKEELKKYNAAEEIPVIDAGEIILNTEEPVWAVKNKKDASMVVAANMLKNGEGDMLISCGSTGALLSAAILIVGRMKGIKRPAIATLLPGENGPVMLLDSGANTNLKAENLLEFAVMGSTYMRLYMGLENPRVALVSNGEEDEKGNELTKKTNALLKETHLNFVGNIEGRDILFGKGDVIVTDGFTGNVIIKTIEGMAEIIKRSLSDIFKVNILRKMFSPVYLGGIKKFKKRMDYREYGGAPLLGIKKPVIKCHGVSDFKAVYKTILKAEGLVGEDFEKELANELDKTERIKEK